MSMLFLCWMFVDVAETVVALLLLCGLGIVQSVLSPLSFDNRILPQHQETVKYEF